MALRHSPPPDGGHTSTSTPGSGPTSSGPFSWPNNPSARASTRDPSRTRAARANLHCQLVPIGQLHFLRRKILAFRIQHHPLELDLVLIRCDPAAAHVHLPGIIV